VSWPWAFTCSDGTILDVHNRAIRDTRTSSKTPHSQIRLKGRFPHFTRGRRPFSFSSLKYTTNQTKKETQTWLSSLIANYAKRLGLPGYSSHQFSVSVEAELMDLA